MSAVKALLMATGLPFPLFTMARNAAHSMEQFKAHPGSVLLSTGAAWEGFDFPGDCVSLLVIPKLPFAYPDARKERERENYPSLQAFIRAVVVPEMQITGTHVHSAAQTTAGGTVEPRGAASPVGDRMAGTPGAPGAQQTPAAVPRHSRDGVDGVPARPSYKREPPPPHPAYPDAPARQERPSLARSLGQSPRGWGRRIPRPGTRLCQKAARPLIPAQQEPPAWQENRPPPGRGSRIRRALPPYPPRHGRNQRASLAAQRLGQHARAA